MDNNSLLKLKSQPSEQLIKDILSILRKHGEDIGVTTVDKCCTQDPEARPVRYNSILGKLEYLDLTGTWVTV